MFGRKNLLAHLESPLTPIGVVMLLALLAYVFVGIFLLGIEDYSVAALMLMPIVAISAYMAFREWALPDSRFARIGRAVGIFNAILVVGYLIYLGVRFYAPSKV